MPASHDRLRYLVCHPRWQRTTPDTGATRRRSQAQHKERVNPLITITSRLIEAYVTCPTKCWLRHAGEHAMGNAYAAWVQAKNEACQVEGIKRLIAEAPAAERDTASPTENLRTATRRIGADLPARAPSTETCSEPVPAAECTKSRMNRPPSGSGPSTVATASGYGHS